MKKYLTVFAVILLISNGVSVADAFSGIETESEQFTDEEGLPKAQKPDIENKLIEKEAAVRAKTEAKKAELGVSNDSSLSSLGISDVKIRVKTEEVISVDVPEEATDEESADAYGDINDELETETEAADETINETTDEVVEINDAEVTVSAEEVSDTVEDGGAQQGDNSDEDESEVEEFEDLF